MSDKDCLFCKKIYTTREEVDDDLHKPWMGEINSSDCGFVKDGD